MKNSITAEKVLFAVERNIEIMEQEKYRYFRKVRVSDVCDELSIFDWWNDYMTISHLKNMRRFLKEAIKLGYNGYVCFKVGASGCANGMWAHKELSEDGYSPDGECLYRSFTPDYCYWQFKDNSGDWSSEAKTIRELESLMA